MNLADVSNDSYTHCGVTARVSLWISAGMEFINYGDFFKLKPFTSNWNRNDLTDGAVIEARIVTDNTGEKALVWLIAERRRQGEERARNEALHASAEAQKKAGDAAIHAARIHRQAEELHCLSHGIDKRSIDSRLA
jgi:hypothetical protein